MALGLMRLRSGELPAEVTSFVGRQQELARLTRLLGAARLVTITGPGGVGKTRVALRAAAACGTDLSGTDLSGTDLDGTYLVELSGLSDPELLPHTIAMSLGLPEQDKRSQLDAVLGYLRERRPLLILDTCEHLLDACALFADVAMKECPGVTLLATSRQPLDVPGEHTFQLAPLPDADAITLFAQRAAVVVPGFTVDDRNRAHISRLCQRLDGIPLAIELATIRLRAVPVAELAERVDEHFRVLTAGRRAALPRHQTLHETISWSYELCTTAEQALWARLSVFAGGFDLPAAEAVCADETQEVLSALVGLVDKSVVLRAAEGDTRYRLLDTLREFGAEQLGTGTDSVRQRHVAYYLGWIDRFGGRLTVDLVPEFRALRADHANLRAALEYALALPGAAEEAAELAGTLVGYWMIAGLLREGTYWLTRVLDLLAAPSAARARILNARSYLATFLGETAGALADAAEAVVLADRLGLPDVGAKGAMYVHIALTFAGRLDEAAAAGEDAAARLAAGGAADDLYGFDSQMAYMHLLAGDLDRCLERCAAGLRQVPDGEWWTTSYLHTIAGLAEFFAGRAAESTEALHKALVMKAEIDDAPGMAYCLEVLGWLAGGQERYRRTAWLLGAAGALWQRTGNRLGGTEVLELLHQEAAATATEALGADAYAALHSAGGAASPDQVLGFALDSDSVSARVAERPALSSREQEIALLVAEGLSNREVAERLVISKRTVDAHVEHIFGKLGISSRVRLATWLKSPSGDQLRNDLPVSSRDLRSLSAQAWPPPAPWSSISPPTTAASWGEPSST
jgi:predicted ATPase/DNA-binding CsgD family transcriptional regulator